MSGYSYDMLVNKQHRLGADFIPRHLIFPDIPFDAPVHDPKRLLEARTARAAAKLFSHARKEHLMLWGISGYRPFRRQLELYEAAADLRYVAPPGASEHQIGLALDVSCPALNFDLTDTFSETPEGRWLSSHAHLYGFILRYPKGKEKVTGYAWEPWHIRYVTKSLALYLVLTGLTLEEYHSYQATAPSDAP